GDRADSAQRVPPAQFDPVHRPAGQRHAAGSAALSIIRARLWPPAQASDAGM
ncbi:MAG: hypothetical protein AVDCRST_MAG61-1770, partial [uncultured Friedmanniella sp.]